MPKQSSYSTYTGTPANTDLIPMLVGGVNKNVTVPNLIRSAYVSVGPTGTYSDYICDGVADQVEILAAYNAVGAAGGGILYIRPGTYDITAHMICGYSNVTIQGAGSGATIFRCGYDGSGGSENTSNGIFGFRNADGITPVSNITLKDCSFDMNSFSGIAIHWKGTTSIATTSKNLRLENVEFYNWGANNTGSTGMVRITGLYNGTAGSLKGLYLTRCVFRDSLPTDSVNKTSNAILITSDDLAVVRLKDCTFENLYGHTINCGTRSAGSYRLRRDWVLEGCDFYNTGQTVFTSSIGDFLDSTREGFDGIKFIGCHFDAPKDYWRNWFTSHTWGSVMQRYNILVYGSVGFVVDHCTFNNGMAVIAPGINSSDPVASEGWTFSNNIISDHVQFGDLDGHFAGTYSNNIFYQVGFTQLGGYGRHKPTSFDGNVFYNCGFYTPEGGANEYDYALFVAQEGGIIIQNNTIYNDVAAGTSNLKYLVYEIDGGGYTSYKDDPNVYKNNTIIGSTGIKTRAFYLNSTFKHVIVGNSGIPETTIQNQLAAGSVSVSALAASDVVEDNFAVGGESVQLLYNQGSVSGAVTFSRSNGQIVKATATGNITSTIPISGQKGSILILQITQDATGGRTISKPSNVKLIGGAFSPSAGAGAVDSWTLRNADGTNWVEVSRALNVS